jgi:hypothetical protein
VAECGITQNATLNIQAQTQGDPINPQANPQTSSVIEKIKLNITQASGKNIVIENVERDRTVRMVKNELSQKLEVPVGNISLTKNQTVLADDLDFHGEMFYQNVNYLVATINA